MEKLEKYTTWLIWLSVIIVAMFTLVAMVVFNVKYNMDSIYKVTNINGNWEIDKILSYNGLLEMLHLPTIHYNSTPTLGYVVTTTMSMNHYMNHKFIVESQNENKEI